MQCSHLDYSYNRFVITTNQTQSPHVRLFPHSATKWHCVSVLLTCVKNMACFLVSVIFVISMNLTSTFAVTNSASSQFNNSYEHAYATMETVTETLHNQSIPSSHDQPATKGCI